MHINLPESDKAIILAASIKVQCGKCKAIWGIYINLAEGAPPDYWDKCHHCEKLSIKSKKEMVNYGISISSK